MRKQIKNKIPRKESADIETFSHDCRGIARIQGKTTFIAGALPGEKVEFQYLKSKPGFDEGKLLSLLGPASELRADPHCAHFEDCGGCSLQHLKTEAQIAVKQNLLLDSLQRIGHVKPETILPPLAAEAWHYRSKARLSVRFVEKKGAVFLGFREKNNPRYIAEINDCPVLIKAFSAEILNLRALIASFDDPRSIAQVELAAGDETLALIFRNLAPLSEGDEAKLRNFGERTGFVLFLQPGSADSVYLLYSKSGHSALHYLLPEEGLQFAFEATDFTQINLPLNQKMVAQALQLLDLNPEDKVLDLFCGLGNFSLPMAKRCKSVIGIEGNAAMVKRAEENAVLNGLHNTAFYALNLDAPNALQGFVEQKALLGLTKVLLDPPRTGAFEIVKDMHHLAPQRIVYVSCNPATLARDAEVLVKEQGYHLKAAGVMDMFSHTAHVESIALFDKEG